MAIGPLDSVQALNRFVRSSPGTADFLGGDVGVDVTLPDRGRLWFFADTLRVGADERPDLVRNSALLFRPGCVRVLHGPDNSSLIPERSDGVGYWPMSAFWADRDGVGHLYVLTQRVHTVSDGPFGFAVLGPAIARFSVSPSGVSLEAVRELGADRRDPHRPAWGAAAALTRRWAYLYGTSTRPLTGIHGFALRVARMRVEDVEVQSRWRYWDGTTWNTDPESAAPLIPEVGGVSQTLSVFRSGGRWWAFSKRDEFLGTDLVLWSGSSPRGPFASPEVVGRLACNERRGELRYMPLAHPELLPRRGTVVISWSRNNQDLAAVCGDPRLYPPHFARLVLPD
ncbi:DUF4185 domain-containing protein [Nocardioides cavernae]|uniref:DUF4185 domain-containing protein n=1 Tax=Nocardioides TaxID=1839 RepID=UPI000A8A5198|nr:MULTISPECIES: DUF4185 domain-containing protein [Nocardioides]MCK9824736.1 DUF4185 domain-containing protein [Nocardioides cavernae]